MNYISYITSHYYYYYYFCTCTPVIFRTFLDQSKSHVNLLFPLSQQGNRKKKHSFLFVLISEGLKISTESHLRLITVACDCLITPVTVHLNIRNIHDESILVALEYITLSTLLVGSYLEYPRCSSNGEDVNSFQCKLTQNEPIRIPYNQNRISLKRKASQTTFEILQCSPRLKFLISCVSSIQFEQLARPCENKTIKMTERP